MFINKKMFVKVKKVTYGKDNKVYITIFHPLADNFPTFRINPEDLEKFKLTVNKENEK